MRSKKTEANQSPARKKERGGGGWSYLKLEGETGAEKNFDAAAVANPVESRLKSVNDSATT